MEMPDCPLSVPVCPSGHILRRLRGGGVPIVQAFRATMIGSRDRLALIDDPVSLDVSLLQRKSLSLHGELMFTRSMFGTVDIAEQGRLLDEVSRLVDAGRPRTTLGEHDGTIDAGNLRRAHVMIESGRAKGKIVLEGFGGEGGIDG